MMRVVIVCLALFAGSSCSNKTYELIGEYETAQYGLVEKAFRNVFTRTSFVSGVSLELKADSSFSYQTCGNEMAGVWFLKNDSLVLHVENNQWRDDSLREYGHNGKWPESGFEMKFEIAGSKLVKIDNHDFLLSSQANGKLDTLEIKRSFLKLERSPQ